MASLEKAERIGGVGLLGLPTFDFFVWLLDNYARGELLMNLHQQLPPWLISPALAFVCMCGGLGLLYLSHQRQLARILTTPSQLVEVEQYRGKERPGWLIPLLWVTLGALTAAPVLALAYSLAYTGTPPPLQAHLKSPTICKTADCFPPKPKVARLRVAAPIKETQSCVGSNCVQGPNYGPLTLNQFGTREWGMTVQQQNTLIVALSEVRGKVRMGWWSGEPGAMNFAGGLLYSFDKAGWTIEKQIQNYAGFECYPTESWDCLGLQVGVTNRTTDAAQTAISALSALHTRFNVLVSDKLEAGVVEVYVSKAP